MSLSLKLSKSTQIGKFVYVLKLFCQDWCRVFCYSSLKATSVPYLLVSLVLHLFLYELLRVNAAFY